MPPEGSVDDDSDLDGGLPDEQPDDDDDPCQKPQDLLRLSLENLDN